MDKLSQALQRCNTHKENFLNLNALNLTQIPNCVFSQNYIAEQLLYLYIGGNKLTKLPPEIEKLVNLKEIHASRNQIISLPSNLLQMDKLKIVALHGNPLDAKSIQVVKQITKKGVKVYM